MPKYDDICSICGNIGAELHEVYYGKNRQLSIQYKMQIRLCANHHRIGKSAIHNDKDFSDRIKREYQEKFIVMYPDLDFVKIFGKNYL